MRRLVVDASVAARFLLVEDLSDTAGRVLDDFIGGEVVLMAPPLITYEVGNVLWKAVSGRHIDEGEAKRRLGAFMEMGIGCLRQDKGECLRALTLSAEIGITFYDASYIAATEAAGAQLITADDTLFGAASPIVGSIHLKDYR